MFLLILLGAGLGLYLEPPQSCFPTSEVDPKAVVQALQFGAQVPISLGVTCKQ
jgi:hypothetical protein